jgi:hypothetical protein
MVIEEAIEVVEVADNAVVNVMMVNAMVEEILIRIVMERSARMILMKTRVKLQLKVMKSRLLHRRPLEIGLMNYQMMKQHPKILNLRSEISEIS